MDKEPMDKEKEQATPEEFREKKFLAKFFFLCGLAASILAIYCLAKVLYLEFKDGPLGEILNKGERLGIMDSL